MCMCDEASGTTSVERLHEVEIVAAMVPYGPIGKSFDDGLGMSFDMNGRLETAA
jgi:hypothetical protein